MSFRWCLTRTAFCAQRFPRCPSERQLQRLALGLRATAMAMAMAVQIKIARRMELLGMLRMVAMGQQLGYKMRPLVGRAEQRSMCHLTSAAADHSRVQKATVLQQREGSVLECAGHCLGRALFVRGLSTMLQSCVAMPVGKCSADLLRHISDGMYVPHAEPKWSS